MTYEERWQQPARRAEGAWQRERGYGGEYEARGPSYSRQEQRDEPYEPYGREEGRRNWRREEEEWQGPPPRRSYGPRFEGFRGEEFRRSPERERSGWGERQEMISPYQGGGPGGYEPSRGYEAGRGGEPRGFLSRAREELGGGERSYGDDPWRGPQQRYGDPWGGPSMRYGDERGGQRWGERFPGQQAEQGYQGRRDWGSSAGSDWGGSERFGVGTGSQGSGSEESRGMRRQSQRGKGPKNYRRSDDRIREEVCERLKQDADLDATEIDVVVLKGEVTLTGETASRAEKRMAEDAAESVSGVQDVTNNIRVRQGQHQESSMEDRGQSSSSRTSISDPSREKARPTASR